MRFIVPHRPRRWGLPTGVGMVPAMYDDDFRVTSEPYRLRPPRKRARPDIREALDAAHVTGSELREAFDLASGTAREPTDPAGHLSWPGAAPSRQRRWLRSLVRTLARVDVWILIATVAGVVIAYLTLVKPG